MATPAPARTAPRDQGHESYLRMNYLYQAAELSVKQDIPGLDGQLLQNLWNLGKKTVRKLDPTLKRTICKKCKALLQPGTTARVRLKSKRQKHVTWTCLTCGTCKRFLLNPKHCLWYDKPEAQVKPGGSKMNKFPVEKKNGGKKTGEEEKKSHREQNIDEAKLKASDHSPSLNPPEKTGVNGEASPQEKS